MTNNFDRDLVIRIKPDVVVKYLREVRKIFPVMINVHTGKFDQPGETNRIIENAIKAGLRVSLDLVRKTRVVEVVGSKFHRSAGERWNKFIPVNVGDKLLITSDKNRLVNGNCPKTHTIIVNRTPSFTISNQEVEGKVSHLNFGDGEIKTRVLTRGDGYVETEVFYTAMPDQPLFHRHSVTSDTNDIETRKHLLSTEDISVLNGIPVKYRSRIGEIVLSFVSNREQLIAAIREIRKISGYQTTQVTAKVETASAVENIREIAGLVDNIVIGCGDLGTVCRRRGWNINKVFKKVLGRLSGFSGRVHVAKGIGDRMTINLREKGELGNFTDKEVKEILNWDKYLGQPVNYWMTYATVGLPPELVPELVKRFVGKIGV